MKNKLIAKYHILCEQIGLTEENRLDLLSGYGVGSSKDLSEKALIDIIGKLSNMSVGKSEGVKGTGVKGEGVKGTGVKGEGVKGEVVKGEGVKGDLERKRVMAVIGEHLKLRNMNCQDYRKNMETIKGIACRAAGNKKFNEISVSELRGIYNEFLKQNKALKNSKLEIDKLTNYLMNNN